jgi:hypothetical protein
LVLLPPRLERFVEPAEEVKPRHEDETDDGDRESQSGMGALAESVLRRELVVISVSVEQTPPDERERGCGDACLEEPDDDGEGEQAAAGDKGVPSTDEKP